MTLGNWITAPRDMGVAAVNFTYNFKADKAIKKAVVNATSIGVYKFSVNGKKVGKAVLTPGWTSYNNRILYQTYDITDMLTGCDTLEFGVGQGWGVSYVGYGGLNHFNGDVVALTASITIEYCDGEVCEIITDESWDCFSTPVISTELYMGETVDMTAPIEHLGKAVKFEKDIALEAQDGEWIVENERLAPVEVIKTPKGELVIDFGQNMTGYVEVKIRVDRGDRIVMHHAEVLDSEGNFYNANYRTARNENIYVCSGDEDVFKPTYCFQGFRYIKLVEYPFDTVDVNNFRAIVVHSEMKRTGYYHCGNEKINQLYHNVIWGHKSNYLDIPTDCPQRPEGKNQRRYSRRR